MKMRIMAAFAFACLGAGVAVAAPRVLLFTKTVEFRHQSIPQGIATLAVIGAKRGWQLDATEDAQLFTDANLAKYDVVVWLSTTGDVLNPEQQGAYERYQKSGKGTVAIHAGGADTEHKGWPWYRSLIGAEFLSHPSQQTANIQVLSHDNPATAGLPDRWSHWDEWYNFTALPKDVTVVLALDETSYDPGPDGMVKKFGSHPLAWYHRFGGGRVFYTALGHTVEDFSDPLFLSHITGAIEWAAAAADEPPHNGN
jgi:cytochrome c